MRINKHFLTIAILIAIMTLGSGCVSHYVLEGSRARVAMRRAIISNDERAIRAIKLGEDAVGVGIDVSNWEAIKERPLLQAGAALADAGILYGTYYGIKYMDDELDSDDNNPDAEKAAGGGNNTSGHDTIVINGDGNNVDTSTTTSGDVVPGQ